MLFRRFYSIIFYVICLPLSLFVSKAQAMHQGFFIGSQLGYSQYEITNKGSIDFDAGAVISVYGGYNFMPWLGLEVAGSFYDEVASDQHSTSLDITQLRFGLVMAGELSSWVDMFAKVQMGQNGVTLSSGGTEVADSTDIALYYEIGAMFNVTDVIGISSSVSHNSSSFDNQYDYMANQVNVGLQFNF